MGNRLDLQTLLEGLLTGVSVYFQPPPNVQMAYPAIVYNRDFEAVNFADNSPYARRIRYAVTVIDKNPDSELPKLIGNLELCKFVRHFTTQGLNHDIFDLYF